MAERGVGGKAAIAWLAVVVVVVERHCIWSDVLYVVTAGVIWDDILVGR